MHFVKEIVQIERRGFAALLAFDQCGAQALDLQFLLFKQPQAGAQGSDMPSSPHQEQLLPGQQGKQ